MDQAQMQMMIQALMQHQGGGMGPNAYPPMPMTHEGGMVVAAPMPAMQQQVQNSIQYGAPAAPGGK